MKQSNWLPLFLLLTFGVSLVNLGGNAIPSVTLASQVDRQTNSPALTVNFTVDVNGDRKPISPLIYGTNRLTDDRRLWASARLGGNRWTGYNWENNASNAGSDWGPHSSDDFVCWFLDCADWNRPAAALETFVDSFAEREGEYVLLTLPMAGYVAADKDGVVTQAQTAPSPRWKRLFYRKNEPFSYPPDLSDGFVYVDEMVAHLVSRYGQASSATLRRGYSLDNEPDLWQSTHPRLHPQKTTAQELIENSADLASAVKAVDPHAQIFAPVHYGFWGMKTLQDAPDLPSGYDWFVDYFLEQMRLRSQQDGIRLVDVFDFHWYPEAQGCETRIVGSGDGNECVQRARMQAPRSLWDETYTENSWIGMLFRSYLPILPRLQSSIQTYYPGTQIALTEFSYGGENHISGGIAVADVLGILGKYDVYFATFYPLEGQIDYVLAAYRLYRNYDKNGGTFGNLSVPAQTSDVENAPLYASIHNLDVRQLHLVVMNRNLNQTVRGRFTIHSPVAYQSLEAWGFDQTSPQIQALAWNPLIDSNTFDVEIPPLSVVHLVLKSDETYRLYPLYLPAILNSSP